MDVLRITQSVGIAGSFIASGIFFASSHLFIPLLLGKDPAISTPVWAQLYYRGAATVPPIALLTALCLGYASYRERSVPLLKILSYRSKSALYAGAAVLALSSVGFTRVAMWSLNARLLNIAGSAVEQSKISVQDADVLLMVWYRLNMVRAALGFAGGVTALYAKFHS